MELGIGVGPEFDEPLVVADRHLDVAAGLLELPQVPLDGCQSKARQPAARDRGRPSEGLEVGDRRVDLTQLSR